MKIVFSILAILVFFVACGGDEIHVIRRDASSGTHVAFIEIVGIEESVDGNVTDRTYIGATEVGGTGAVITAVAGDDDAIGYISMGSLNDSVRAVNVNGVSPTSANVQNGSYPLFRSFYLAMGDDISPEAMAFLEFVESATGQAIIAGRGYIPAGGTGSDFVAPDGLSGTVVISGSTSVAPVMRVLEEEFEAIVPSVNVEVHSTGSGAGITAALDGMACIGMTSRAIRQSEFDRGIRGVTLAHDGLVVIVNRDNALRNLTLEQILNIFIGETRLWDDVN